MEVHSDLVVSIQSFPRRCHMLLDKHSTRLGGITPKVVYASYLLKMRSKEVRTIVPPFSSLTSCAKLQSGESWTACAIAFKLPTFVR